MHVLIIPSQRYLTQDSPISGIFQYHQAHALSRAGLDVGIIAPAPRSLRDLARYRSGWVWGIDHSIEAKVPIYRFQGLNWPTGRVWPLYQAYFDWIGQRLYVKYEAQYGKPDLIHAHIALPAGVFASRCLAKRNVPFVITEHSSLYGHQALSSWQRTQAQRAFERAAARIVVSPSLGKNLESELGSAAAPWEVVPNIIDSQFELAALTPRRKSSSAFTFLNIGFLEQVKNQDGLLRAFAHAFAGKRHVTLRVGGDGPLRKMLDDLARSLGISEQVTFLGRLDRSQVLTEMRECDSFVLSSHYETFGVVLIEAAACGKPVVAIAGSGPDSIVCKETGILAAPGSEDALAAAMLQMVERVADYSPVVIRNSCLSRFGETAVVDRLKTIYGRVLSR